ncbi:ABC transporter substrate-binding protein [Microbacterium sp. SORGH_AS_0888]|uniref:ABC transporter substrate-binding protein n=1 Tax=Microbacterium sp. SORGH_AS_0888 TaxID=3041791 RepID=UPI00277EADEB|nr:ABC transporter substrate-binding protein [Microbacterium sp. SORGH_AS_0888]MDQ1130437.1 peptide/nickel transport system substrate-binding protein [Microbacterium sp. SORGH_AS_0888]
MPEMSDPHAPRRRLRRSSLALVLAAAFALSACAAGGSGTSSSADAGSTITIVQPDNNMGWSLDYTFSGMEQSINTQATLLRKPYVDTDQAGVQAQNLASFQPYLAESMDVSSDGLVYTFHLRKGVVSAHGNPLTAEDVRWSFERKFKTATSVSYPAAGPVWYDPAKQISVVDDMTVSFTLTDAGYGSEFQALLSDVLGEVYDSVWLKQNATAEDPYAVAFSAKNPNFGFGPYEVTQWDPSTGATLVARDDAGLPITPAVKTIIVRIVPDSGARVTAVQSGSADIAENVDPAALADLSKNPSVTVPAVDNSNQHVMIPLLTNKAPFDNQLVRQAFAYAVPYQQIIDNVFHGRAVRNGSGFLDTKAPGYSDAGLPDYTYDPAKAKSLLAQAGVSAPVAFSLVVSASDPDLNNAAIQIKSAAADAGFDVTIDKQDQSAFNAQRVDHSSQAFILRDYAITMTPGYELNVYTAKGSGNNLADWEDDTFYSLKAAGYAFPDAFSSEAGAAWAAAQAYWITASPIVFVAQTQPPVLLSSKVTGYATRSDQWMDYSNLSVTR